jgi:transcriptional regulator with XRE-family HTH domain
MEFKKIIERIKTKTGYTQKEIAALIFGISDKNLSNKIKRNSVDLDLLLKWADNESVDLNWLFGKEDSPGEIAQTSNIIETRHADIIQRFNDKSYAMDLNLHLVELERLSPEAYRKVGSYIQGVVDGVRMMADRCPDETDKILNKGQSGSGHKT